MPLNKFNIQVGDIVIRIGHSRTKYKVVWVEGKWAWIRLQDIQSVGVLCPLADLDLTTA